MRRSVAAVASAALVLEACGLAFYNLVLGLAVRRQSMSLAGLPAGAMAAGAFAAGAVIALFLLACAAVAARTAVADRSPRRWARMVLVAGAVLNGVLGAAAVGIVGWAEFAGAMGVLGLLVGTLLGYPGDRAGAAMTTDP